MPAKPGYKCYSKKNCDEEKSLECLEDEAKPLTAEEEKKAEEKKKAEEEKKAKEEETKEVQGEPTGAAEGGQCKSTEDKKGCKEGLRCGKLVPKEEEKKSTEESADAKPAEADKPAAGGARLLQEANEKPDAGAKDKSKAGAEGGAKKEA